MHTVICTCCLCRNGCWIMWPCYGSHITVCMALLVYVLCQLVHSCIEPSLHQLDFCLEIFAETFWLKSFNNLLRVPPMHLMRHPCTCAPIPTASTLLPPQSSPQNITSGKSQLCLKQGSNKLSIKNFMAIGGCFECYTYCIMALGWVKKKKERKKERKKEDEQFRLLTVSGLPL